MVLSGCRKATTTVMLPDELLVSACVARRFAHTAGFFTAGKHLAQHLRTTCINNQTVHLQTAQSRQAAAGCCFVIMPPAEVILGD